MASDVDIANLALAHLGEDATVSNLDPPEGSAQADHCATFYPLARDALLEMHTWNFSTRRQNGAQLEDGLETGWQYAYIKPTNALIVFAVLPPGAPDDYSAALPNGTITLADGSLQSPAAGVSVMQTQPFAIETNEDGDEIIVTNQAEAVIRYGIRITDTQKFSPLFTTTLSWLLASYLAGPILKGEVGRNEAARCLQMATVWFGRAVTSDSNQRRVLPHHSVPWLAVR
jgi:hypothetical protein